MSFKKTQIGSFLKKIRKKKGISKYKINKKNNLRYDIIKGIEDGDKNYTIDSFMFYCDAIGVEFSFKQKKDMTDV